MGLLDIAWRKLVEYAATKAIKKAKEYFPSTPKPEATPSLTWGGVVSAYSNKYIKQKESEDTLSNIIDTATAFAPNVKWLFVWTKWKQENLGSFVKESSTLPATEDTSADFELYKQNWYSMFDIAKAEKLTKDITDIGSFWNVNANKEIRTKLGETKFKDIMDFRNSVSSIKDVYKNKETWKYNRWYLDTVTSGIIKGAPGWTAIADFVSWGTFTNKEAALNELERDNTDFSANRWIETAVTIGSTFWAYWAFGKLVDKWLLSTKVPSSLAKAQSVLRESYVKNPFIFNLTSNSAQEAIEYGVNKGLWNDNYSISDFMIGLTVGWAAAKAFGSKTFESVFDNISQKDLSNINSALETSKKQNPDMGKNELVDSISETKLTNGLTFGQLKQSFIDAGWKAKDTLETTQEAITQFFQSSGSVISGKASKRFKSTIEQVNGMISKWTKDTWGLSNTKDISLFKSDVLAELQWKASITFDEMDEVLTRKAKEYNLQLNKSANLTDMMDEAEEIILKSDSQISNLANPKTMDGFKSTYANTTNTSINDIYKLQEEIDNLSSLKANGTRLTKIEANESAIKNILQEANVKSVSELEDKIYKINSDEVLRIAKETRAKWVVGKVTNAEKQVVRDNLIKETKRLEAESEKVIGKLSWVKSTSKKGDFARIIQFTQLKNGMESGNYIGSLKTFISVNKAALKGDLATAVEAQGGKVFRPTKTQLKKLDVAKYANDNGYDGYVTKTMQEGKLEDSYTSLNDNFKWIDATAYWSNGKQIAKDRIRMDVEEAAQEASLQKWGKFKLAEDETSGFLDKFQRAIRLRSWVVLSALDSYNRTFSRVFGEDSHIKKVLFDDVDSARWDWELEKIAFNKEVLNWATYANLKDIQRQRKFMIAMTARQWGVSDRITLANNIKIKDGVIYDDLKDTTFFKWASKAPEDARKLTENEINYIIKEVESDKLMQPLIKILDNKFNDVAWRINAMHYNDSGVLIPTESKYFPIHYIDANYYHSGEEPKWMKQIFNSHVQQGFINARKWPASDFSLNMDFPSFMKDFGNNQLYYLHMKSPIMRAKRMVRVGNQKGISQDIITANKNWGIDFNDIDDVVEGSPIFTPTMKRFNDRFIERIENRGVIPNSNFLPTRIVSNLGTWATIAWNPWSAIAQPFSIIDSLANTSAKNVAKWLYTLGKDFYRWNNRQAFKYSGDLLARQTEHIQNTAKWFFSNQDLAAMSKQRITDNILEKMNDAGLRMMKRVDWEVSYSVWHWYFYDFLEKEVKTQFPDLKITSDIDSIKAQLNDDVWFNKAIKYADKNMTNVMGGSTAFTHWSPLQSIWPLYKASTLIQKTFINRMLFLNSQLENWPLWKTLPTVACIMALQEGMETEREYWRAQYNEEMGSKKEPTDIQNHLDGIRKTNSSLTFDSYLSEAIQWGIKNSAKIVTWEDVMKLDEGQILTARAMSRFIWNTIWNPAWWYELTSAASWIKKWLESDDKWNILPDNRDEIVRNEAILKMIIPNIGRTWLDIAHNYIFGEPLWQTVEDNYQLGKITKDNPDKLDVLNKLDFAAQWAEAKISKGIYDVNKWISEKNAQVTAKSAELVKDMFSIYWVPTQDEIKDYARKNKSKFSDIGITKVKELDKFIVDTWEYGRKIATWEASMLPKNIKVIYEYKLKKIAEWGSKEEMNKAINELVESRVINDKNGTIKKIKWFLKRDKLLWYSDSVLVGEDMDELQTQNVMKYNTTPEQPINKENQVDSEIIKDTKKDLQILWDSSSKNVWDGVVKFFSESSERAKWGILNFIDEEMWKWDIFWKREEFNKLTWLQNQENVNVSKMLDDGWYWLTNIKNIYNAAKSRDDSPINIDWVSIRPWRLWNILLWYNAEISWIDPDTRNIWSYIVASITPWSGKWNKEIIDRALYDAGKNLAKKWLSLENLKFAIKEWIEGRYNSALEIDEE